MAEPLPLRAKTEVDGEVTEVVFADGPTNDPDTTVVRMTGAEWATAGFPEEIPNG